MQEKLEELYRELDSEGKARTTAGKLVRACLELADGFKTKGYIVGRDESENENVAFIWGVAKSFSKESTGGLLLKDDIRFLWGQSDKSEYERNLNWLMSDIFTVVTETHPELMEQREEVAV